MMFKLPKSTADALGYDLAQEVAAFAAQLEAHKSTVGVPAPTSWPLVERIVREHGGEFLIEDDTPPPPPPGPKTCTPLQARRALRAAGLLSAVQQAVNDHESEDLKDAFEYATEWRRDDPWIEALGASLGLTPQDIDALFDAAASL